MKQKYIFLLFWRTVRVEFSKDELHELAESIKANGLVQPIIVRALTKDSYEIVAGERRWRAAQLAGLASISCIQRNYDDEQAAAITTVENLNRVDLNPIEEAKAFETLLINYNYSHEEIASAVGKSRSTISNSLRLLTLPAVTQQAIINAEISEGHAKILAGLDLSLVKELTLRCVREKLSVRKLEQILKSKHKPTLRNTNNDISALERKLSDYLSAPTNIQQSGKSLKLQIECYDSAVLGGILEKIGFSEDL